MFRLVTSNSVEEGIIEVAKRKLALDGQVIQAGKFDGHTSAEERDNFLRSLLERGDDEPEEDAEPDEDTLNEILARGEDELEMFQRMDAERPEKDRAEIGDLPRLMQVEELPPAYQKKYEKVEEVDLYDPEETGRGQRKRTTINYGEDAEMEDFWKAIDGGDSEDEDDEDSPKKKSRRRPKGTSAAASKQNSSRPSPTPSEMIKFRRGRQMGRERTADGEEDEGLPEWTVANRKRARNDSISASIADDDVKPSHHKRAKTTAAVRDPNVVQVERTAMLDLWNTVVNATDPETGEVMSAPFRAEVPKSIADYYQLIKRPMWLDKIKRQISKYQDIAAFKRDMDQVWANAKQYNLDDSLIYIFADHLDKVCTAAYEEKLRELGYGENGEPEEQSSAGTPAASVKPMRFKLKMGGRSDSESSVPARVGGVKLKLKANGGSSTPSSGRVGRAQSSARSNSRKRVQSESGEEEKDEEEEEEAGSSGMED